ncbi:hypothetical protein [Calothrix sp. UHCC 0171]|uniref:hypothetical protein n=1 Tax=Calothrix sp. UHCC 0171 TaxID=3110245 RepID=UPI002B216C3E|nr:hypothetical protein [Calothrix sp. UHCC 0171]MEA5571543.1 hypothetical protein [Calothrix sp. UHCC 0171]
MKAHPFLWAIIAFTATLLNPLILSAQNLPSISLTPSIDYAISSQNWMKKYAERSIEQLGGFIPQNQLYIYETIQYRAYALWASRDSKVLTEVKSKLGTREIILNLIDKNNDGKPDEFVYHLPGDQHSQDFGFMFDLNRDGKMDYFVFNGGPLYLKKEFQNAREVFSSLFWMNYHWIDSNYDDKIDIAVFNDIDIDGDGNPDKGVTAWVYDDNFDGRVDRVEYLGYTPWFPMDTQYGKLWEPEKNQILNKPIEAKNGEFTLKRSLNPKVFNQQVDIRNTALISDIHSAVGKQ